MPTQGVGGNISTVESSSRAPRQAWRSSVSRVVLITDAITITSVVFITQIAWLGVAAEFRGDIPYWLISIVIIIAWLWALSLNDSRSHRVMGVGWTEYLRVISASFRFFGGIAIIAYLAKADIARGYLLLSLPIGLTALLLGRALCRTWLLRQRARGRFSARTLLVGTPSSVARLASELQRARSAGFVAVGACLPKSALTMAVGHATVTGSNVPIVGDLDNVVESMKTTRADTVVIAAADEIPAQQVKAISWALEAGRQHLLLSPGILDVAGPRMHIRPVAGLPLIHVETPTFSRGQRFVKRSFDLVASSLGIIALSPLFLLLALLVRLTSPGPALFFQERTGRNGKPFKMVKFRSMIDGAEDHLEELRAQQTEFGNEVMFKLKDDPRVTAVGSVMRKFSLDELPQLFNVFAGTMSLVGPRPPLPQEVEKYASHVHRRFLMKPGITGPWQVGGRSTLSWEETVRLDLSYVENWSLANDLMILFKTVKVVVAPGDTAH